MSDGIGVAGIYVHDQDEALAFYVGKLGLPFIPMRRTATSAG